MEGAAPGQAQGKRNILDYSDFGEAIKANLTDSNINFNKDLVTAVVTEAVPILPLQERWVYDVEHPAGRVATSVKIGLKLPAGGPLQDGDKFLLDSGDLSRDLQNFKSKMANLLKRTDFTVDREIFTSIDDTNTRTTKSRYTVTFSAPGPTNLNLLNEVPKIDINGVEKEATKREGKLADNAIHNIYSKAASGFFTLKLRFPDIQVGGKMFEVTTQNINFDAGPDAVRSNIQSSIESALSIARMSDYELNLQLLENDSATSQPTKDDGTLVHGVLVLAKEKGHALELVEEGYLPSIILKLPFVIRIV